VAGDGAFIGLLVLLRFADKQVRESGALDSAIRAAGPTIDRVTITPAMIGDLGVDLGRGYERVAKKAGVAGPIRLIPNLRSVTAVYNKNPSTGKWETITIYPAR
jgi:hypothetical protein